jgi:hypothetical protein
VLEPRRPVANAPENSASEGWKMSDLDAPSDIDMDRVVADRDYRRRVIHRLRQERMLAEAQKTILAHDPLESGSDDD